MKKLIIQIPCLNEEETLPVTLNDLPKEIEGIDVIEILVIDDGSTDRTVEVAKAHGVDHIVSLPQNLGLANAFQTGIAECLKRGADFIVNTDADNQYVGADVKKIVTPVLNGEVDIAIGARPIDSTQEFSRTKKFLQKLGSWVVRIASNSTVPDAPSGFRCFSRYAAKRIKVLSNYSYTLETIIQASLLGLVIKGFPIKTNPATRKSRLVKSSFDYVVRSAKTIVWVLMIYRPFRFFGTIGIGFFSFGLALGLRFLYYHFFSPDAGHVQSVVLSGSLLSIGVLFMVAGFVTDLISVNRRLLERLELKIIEHQEEVLQQVKDGAHDEVQKSA